MIRMSRRKLFAVGLVPVLLIGLISAAMAQTGEPIPEACLQSSMICSGLSVPEDSSESTGTETTTEDDSSDSESTYEPPTCTAWDGTEGIQEYAMVDAQTNADWKQESPRFEADGVTPQEGDWYRVTCGGSPTTNQWIPAASGEPAAVAAPVAPPAPTAAEARNATPIPDADIVIDPNALGLAGLLTNFTTSATTPISSTSSVRGYSIIATAQPTSYAWEFGDDDYDQGQRVSHTYQTRMTYTVTLTVTYTGSFTWSGNGRSGSGDLGSVERSTSRDYKVIEARGVLSAVA